VESVSPFVQGLVSSVWAFLEEAQVQFYENKLLPK